MKDIKILQVQQVRIFEPDRIPFRAVSSGAGQKLLMEACSFREVAFDQASGEWVFRGGSVTVGDEVSVAIEMLQVSERRIVIGVEGDTSQLNDVMGSVSAVLQELDPGNRWLGAEPLITTNETNSVAELSFDWRALFSEQVVTSVLTQIDSFVTRQASPSLKSFGIAFRIRYLLNDERIRDYGITLSDKHLVIEPRVNTPLSRKLYFIASPTDSDRHLELIAAMEDSLSRGQ